MPTGQRGRRIKRNKENLESPGDLKAREGFQIWGEITTT